MTLREHFERLWNRTGYPVAASAFRRIFCCASLILACGSSSAAPPTQPADSRESLKQGIEESRRITQKALATCAKDSKVAFFTMEGEGWTYKCIGPDDPKYKAAQRANQQLEAVMKCDALSMKTELRGAVYVCVPRLHTGTEAPTTTKP